jgi:uncharacterized protein YutE (UPF0331/DUF86 family)
MTSLNQLSPLEERRLRRAAREYEKQGFNFIPTPGAGELPAFLSGFSPTAIAYGKTENVVIEVKTTPSLQQAGYLPEMAARIQEQPGWRLELIVTNSTKGTKPVENWPDAFINRREIYTRLGEVQNLLDAGYDKAALLLLWSAVEATLHLLAYENEINPQVNTPLHALKSLVSLAVISRPEYEVISEAFKSRNAIAHGLRTAELDPTLVQALFEVEMRLLKA